MTHEDVFLQEILENREDDTPRRIFADWLIDHDDPVLVARGEFIHLQCLLARRDLPTPTADPDRKRERQLIEKHGREWGSLFQRIGCQCWEYRRGFVEGIGVSASAFLTAAPTMFRAAPIDELKIYQGAGRLGDLGKSPWLTRIRMLDLEKNDLGDGDLEELSQSCFLTELTSLLLWGNRICDAGVAALIATSLPSLTRLDLSGNIIGDAGAITLANSTLFGRLQMLDLTANQIGDAGAQALASSAFAETIGRLDITKNPMSQVGQSALRRRFGSRVHVWG